MKKLVFFVLSVFVGISASAQTPGFSSLMIQSHGEEWSAQKSWDYVSGLVTKSILMYCAQYPDEALSARAYEWCKTYADIALYDLDSNGNFSRFVEGSLDNIASGKVLLDLYLSEASVNPADSERYRRAADYLYDYLRNRYTRINRTDGKGCFFHKYSYPDQMWLDGLYMGSAFYAEYLSVFPPTDEKDGLEAWADIALQFKTIHKYTYNADKSLNYHGWSANPSDPNSFWANRTEPYQGCSKEFWGRGLGWYAAALVDVLAVMPTEHPDYEDVAAIFSQVADGIVRWQDSESGVWYQLLQYDSSFKSSWGTRNYLEASASSMFTYALLKGIRLGLLDESYIPVALKAYDGLIKTFITQNGSNVDIHKICRSAGLGPAYNRERDGSANYYLDGSDVTVVSNEGKGIGSFIMASLEYEKFTTSSLPAVKANPVAPAMIFDIHGRQYPEAPGGLYIELRGGTATKRINR